MDSAKVPGLADSHIDGNEPWTFAEVTRNQCLTNGRPQIEVSKLRADDGGHGLVAIHSVRCKRGTLCKESISICVLPGGDIEGPARARHNKWIQAQLPPGQIESPGEGETMPHIECGATKFSG